MAWPAVAKAPLSIYRGDSYSCELKFVGIDQTTPVDMTAYGSNWCSQLRKTTDSTTAIDFTIDSTQSNVGIVKISLTPEKAASITSDGVWDIQVMSDTGSVTTLLTGTYKLGKDTTRAVV